MGRGKRRPPAGNRPGITGDDGRRRFPIPENWQVMAAEPPRVFTPEKSTDEPAVKNHLPVLPMEILEWAGRAAKAGLIVDGTLGEAGHLTALANRFPSAQMVGMDQDPEMLERAADFLARALPGEPGGRVKLYQSNYYQIPELPELSSGADFILLDIGVSSFHFDNAGRGFSYTEEGELDMRLDPRLPVEAAQIIRTWPRDALADLFYWYGEERLARKFARVIVEERDRHPELFTAKGLADLLWRLNPPRSRNTGNRIHPATRVFQALRIVVNQELTVLEKAIPRLAGALAPGGVLAIISFHSLEDRIVKYAFRDLCRGNDFTAGVKKPIIPAEEESRENRRARSAKLRVLIRESTSPLSS